MDAKLVQTGVPTSGWFNFPHTCLRWNSEIRRDAIPVMRERFCLVNAVQVRVTTMFFSLTFWSALTSTTIVPGHLNNGPDLVNGR